VPKEQFEMISQNQNSFENLGTILLDLLTRRGKTITEELRDALAFFMLHLGQAEHLGGLCALFLLYAPTQPRPSASTAAIVSRKPCAP